MKNMDIPKLNLKAMDPRKSSKGLLFKSTKVSKMSLHSG